MKSPWGKSTASGLQSRDDRPGGDRWLTVAVPLALCTGLGGIILGSFIVVSPITEATAKNLVGGFLLMHLGATGGMIAGAAFHVKGNVQVALELDSDHDRGILLPVFASALLAIAFFPLALALSAASAWTLETMGFDFSEASPLLAYMDPGRPVLMVAALACVTVVAPFSEEIFFRLGMHDLLRYLGVRSAALWVATIFAVFHGQLFAIPGLFLLSLLLQRVRGVFGTLWSPIALHGVYNLCAVTAYLIYRGTA